MIWKGIPIRSESLNFTPTLSSLSSYNTSKFSDKSLEYNSSENLKQFSSLGFKFIIIKSNGEISYGQIIPLESLLISIDGAGIVEIPIP